MLEGLFIYLTEGTRWRIYKFEFKKFVFRKDNTIQQFILKYSQICV